MYETVIVIIKVLKIIAQLLYIFYTLKSENRQGNAGIVYSPNSHSFYIIN